MIPVPPKPDELVEALLNFVMEPPDGYKYHDSDGQLLFPVFGQDRWRLLLRKGDTLVPVFIEGAFILKLAKALHAMQRELNAAVSDDIPEPVIRAEVPTCPKCGAAHTAEQCVISESVQHGKPS